MGFIEQTCISMVSKRTKESIRNLNIFKGLELCIHISESVSYRVSKNRTVIFIISIGYKGVTVSKGPTYQERFTFTTQKFNAKSCLNHFLYVINPTKIDDLHFSIITGTFDDPKIQMAVECLKGLRVVNLNTPILSNTKTLAELVKTFEPTEHLKIHRYPFQTLGFAQLFQLREILPGKFPILSLNINMPLNGLLLTSSSSVGVNNNRLLTSKDFNIFLKHWIAGLKPELECIRILDYRLDWNEHTVLKGIPYEVAPMETKIKFRRKEELQLGGFDFTMSSGVKATLHFHYWDRVPITEISVVLHDSEIITFL